MSTATIAAPPLAPDRTHRWAVADFDRMIAADSVAMLQEYARAGVVQYWIVHINARRVKVYENLRVEAGVGMYDAPRLFGLDTAVPLVLRAGPGGPAGEFPAIPVADILRDSLEEGR